MDKNQLLGERRKHIDAARAILAKQEAGQKLTPSENAAGLQHIDEAKRLSNQLKQVNGDAAVHAAIAAFSDGTTGSGTKSTPTWAVKSRPTSPWARETADKLLKASGGHGQKAVVGGAYETSQVLLSGIDQAPQYPTRILDLLFNIRTVTSQTFNWLHQTVRTNNAAPVADGALKPTSIYTIAEREGRVCVIAHVSEALPLRLADDIDTLFPFLESEMAEGLRRAVEQQVLNGNGTGENMTGLLNTSGIRVQTWDEGGLLHTLRKASTVLEVAGETPTAWAIHPTDVETLDLLTDADARHYFNGPAQQLGQSAPVWSLPIVRSVAVPPGKAILGDWSQVQLIVREGMKIDVNTTGGDLFEKNLFKLRVEGRYGNAVLRPSAFVEVATAEPEEEPGGGD